MKLKVFKKSRSHSITQVLIPRGNHIQAFKVLLSFATSVTSLLAAFTLPQMCWYFLCEILSWARIFLLWIFLATNMKCVLLSSFPLIFESLFKNSLWLYFLKKKSLLLFFMKYQKETEICQEYLHSWFSDFPSVLIGFHSVEIKAVPPNGTF